MKRTDFNFDLPEELIAQHPSGIRGEDKLMLLNRLTGEVFHHNMADFPDLIQPGTLMIFNNSRGSINFSRSILTQAFKKSGCSTPPHGLVS